MQLNQPSPGTTAAIGILQSRRDLAWLLACLIVGLALRLDLLVANNFVIDSDEAIVGLMAKHILEGRGIPTFYYGQHYMGSLEPLTASLFFWLFGASSLVLKCVPLAYSLVFIILCYELALVLSNRTVARLTALFSAIAPSTLLTWSSMARGGFIEILVLGTLALILLVHWLRSDFDRPFLMLSLGLVLGIGWWTNNQIIFYMLPTGILCVYEILSSSRFASRRLVGLLKTASIGLCGFLLGGAPYWIYNLLMDFPSLGMFSPASQSDVGEHLSGVLELSLPILLGAKRFWHREDIFPYSSIAVSSLYLALFLVVVCKAFFPRPRMQNVLAVALPALFIFGCIGIFCASTYGHLVEAPRYLLPLYSVTNFVIAYGCMLCPLALRVVLIAVLLGVNLASTYWGERAIPGEPHVAFNERVSKDNSELIQWLESKNINYVATNYWIGYRLAFETLEKVTFSVFQEPSVVRIPNYERQTSHSSDDSELPPFVLVPSQEPIVARALSSLGYTFEREQRSGYKILFSVKRASQHLIPLVDPAIQLNASLSPDEARLAMDHDENTRWASHHPQRPGMTFSVTFREPTSLRGLRLETGKWQSDAPRGLEVSALLEDGNELKLLDRAEFSSIRYLVGGMNHLLVSFPAQKVRSISLQQTGTDPIFDWSIAELYLFR